MPPIEEKSSGSQTVLWGIALILVGILLGILASRFVPASPETTVEIEPTETPIEEITPTEVPIVTPTATPSALLSLKWNVMTAKSPVKSFSSYRISYPSTWSIKEYKNTPLANDQGSSVLTLKKDQFELSIIQRNQLSSSCDYSGNPEVLGEGVIGFVGDFHGLLKDNAISWRWALSPNVSVPEYIVCESKNPDVYTNATSIGFINFSSENVDPETLDEINYILEKIVILP